MELESLHDLAERRWNELSEDNRLRVRRALSWCHRASTCPDDDGRFIFSWIAFNAAYGRDLPGSSRGERDLFMSFVRHLVDLDRERWQRLIEDDAFFDALLRILANPYVHEDFWRAARQGRGITLDKQDERLRHLRGHGDTARVLSPLLDALYVLRNQLVHGGATWQSSVNREQVRDGALLMQRLSRAVVATMLDHPTEDWGDPWYPPVQPNGQRSRFNTPYHRPRKLEA